MIIPAEVPRGTGLTISVEMARMTDPEFDWAVFDNRFARSGAEGVMLSVGHADAPLYVGPEATSAEARFDEPVDRALHLLEVHGIATEVTMVINASMPTLIRDAPENAGVGPDGARSSRMPSACSLHSGAARAALVAVCREVSERYRPARISLTELILDSTYGDDDARLFEEMMGQPEFPRDEFGRVDVTSESTVRWRTRLLVGLLAACAKATLPGTELDVEMRVNWDEPGADRADSGHAYAAVLAPGHSVTLWDSFGLHNEPPTYSAQLVEGLGHRFGPSERDRLGVSVGLWNKRGSGQGETISPFDLRIAIENMWGSIGTIVVAPAGLMSAEHWKVLAELRGGGEA